ncbi:unnamed protein product [Vicia faba]|uniref:Uncharacterized protein n=1 Tax=Vicia faba TaxID=3906 RepID=A0AAV1AZS4_VICFA|nr:unnamed protein product [Vicia faba]
MEMRRIEEEWWWCVDGNMDNDEERKSWNELCEELVLILWNLPDFSITIRFIFNNINNNVNNNITNSRRNRKEMEPGFGAETNRTKVEGSSLFIAVLDYWSRFVGRFGSKTVTNLWVDLAVRQ